MNNFNDFNPNNNQNNNNNVDWDNYVNNDNFNQMNQNNVNNNNDYYNYNGYNYNNIAPQPKKSKKGCLIAMLVVLILIFVGGVGLLIFNSDRTSYDKYYNEYTRLENINDVIGTNALSVEAKFYQSDYDYYDSEMLYVVLEVTNDSDYFINDLPVKYFSKNYLNYTNISMRPHTKAVLDCFSIEDKDQDYYKDMELKDPGHSSNKNVSYLGKEAKEDIIYASDIQIEITKIDDQGVHFKVNNSSKYDFDLESFYTKIFAIDSKDTSVGEIVTDLKVKDINSKDSSTQFNIPKEGSRELIYAPYYDGNEFDPKLDYQIIITFCGKQVI